MSVRMVPGAAVVGGALLGASVVLVAAPAHAHNVLERTTPAAGSSVATAPSAVELDFDRTVLGIGTAVKVTGPDGDVQDGKPTVVDGTVTQSLRAGAPAGAYTVAWRATSVDGHPISSTFTFTARTASAGATSPASAGAPVATATQPATTVADGDPKPGEDTSWPKVIGAGALGAALGAAYVLFQRNRRKRQTEDPS
jgi:methionine-rich copper-binding protein CopC